MDPLQVVYTYHDETKHHFRRSARSAGYMDWDTQPDPFRRYAGAPLTLLPRQMLSDHTPAWDDLFSDTPYSAPLNDASLGAFFYSSLALSAWKEVVNPEGEVVSRWALRVNPSSGNLHPTEGWLANAKGVFHYRPDVHGLEQTATWADNVWQAALADLPPSTFLVGLSSIPWRESWKYGERAFRYCQHDVGHALAALSLGAASLGWSVAPISGIGHDPLEALFGLEGRVGCEVEHPDLLFAVFPEGQPCQSTPVCLPQALALDVTPNALSPGYVDWDIINDVATAVMAPTSDRIVVVPPVTRSEKTSTLNRDVAAIDVIRRRRSAVAMDGQTSMTREAFYTLLSRLLPSQNNPAFDLFHKRTAVSLMIMVHRVDNLQSGLYMLVRDPDHLAFLQAVVSDLWSWQTPTSCPPDLPLYFLGEADLRVPAGQLSCRQDIAADGVFTLGMLARFDHTLKQDGPSAYLELFWETGAIGQMLYLEAEAVGLSGTGIGCFFDDEVHRVLGITDHSWQSLYHFTVGRAVVDDRLRTAPPYDTAITPDP